MLLVTGDSIGARLAGSAARCLALARALSEAGHVATVAAPSVLPDSAPQPFAIRSFERSSARAELGPLLQACDVVVLPFYGLFELPFLFEGTLPLVFDLSDPIPLEILEAQSALPRTGARLARDTVEILNQVLERGDFFLCASERQRDLWLGALLSRGRILERDPGDPMLRRLIDVVPFGISSSPPVRSGTAGLRLRGAHPAIASDAFIVAWGGALWDWLDPIVAIRAMALVPADRCNAHLVFLGTSPPGVGPKDQRIGETERLAHELGVKDRCVHFLEGWIPYEERGQALLECDAGLTTHGAHLESRFAFRTRVLDYLWAGLPIICTRGDVLAELVEAEGLGIVVGEEDSVALAGAILRLANDGDFAAACRARIAAVRPRFTWQAAAAPLVRFCDEPRRSRSRNASASRLADASALLYSALRVLVSEGPREAARRTHRMLVLGQNRRRP